MITQRFNTDLKWRNNWPPNHYMFGFFQLLEYLESNIEQPDATMIEIGSYMGESTMLFASTGIFSEIHAIDPFDGYEKMNDEYGYDWEDIKWEFKKNTRFFHNIIVWMDYSYNVVDKFSEVDFVYIDGSHTYEDTKRDIELYLPKCKSIIGGHDYHEEHPGVKQAVDELLGKPDEVFRDHSWVKKL